MFKKHSHNPVIARKPNSFCSVYTANPDILEFNGKLFYYFRGQGDDRHDQLGLAITDKEHFDGVNWETVYPEPILTVSPEADAPDSLHILDPAGVVWNGRVYVYYSAYSTDGSFSVCLATSDDGIHFERYAQNPIIPNALAPEALVRDGKLYLFYQVWTDGQGGTLSQGRCCVGNGTEFDFSVEEAQALPKDCVSVTTRRIYTEGETYYCFYGKCKRFRDYPESIGLARSKDLLHWEHSNKDVLTRGEPGSWDEGAMWFPTVYKHNGTYYLWYEGGGTGNGRRTADDVIASECAINEEYGGYGITNFSQIGLATYNGSLEDFFK